LPDNAGYAQAAPRSASLAESATKHHH
jgi:hypothetical protein